MPTPLETAIDRLSNGYWNLGSKTDANPGGLGADGHRDNWEPMLAAIGLVTEHVGTQGALASEVLAIQAEVATVAAAADDIGIVAEDIVAVLVAAANMAAIIAAPAAATTAATKADEAADSANAAAASAAGVNLPPIEAGDAGKYYRVKDDETGSELVDISLFEIGYTLTSVRDPGAGWLLADGSVVLQSAYPALYAEIGDDPHAGLEYVGTWGDTTNINALGFGGGLFVGVGPGGVIRTASDFAGTWTTRTSPVSVALNDIVYNSVLGLWLITGPTGTILTASDPTGTWTQRNPGSSYSGEFSAAVSLGAAGFMIGGAAGEIQYSADGVTWVRRLNLGGATFYSSAAVSASGEVIFTSRTDTTHRRTDDLGLTFNTQPVFIAPTINNPGHVVAQGDDFYLADSVTMVLGKRIGGGFQTWMAGGILQGGSTRLAVLPDDRVVAIGNSGRLSQISRAGGPFRPADSDNMVNPAGTAGLNCVAFLDGAIRAGHNSGQLVQSAPACDLSTEFILPDLSGGAVPVYIKAEG